MKLLVAISILFIMFISCSDEGSMQKKTEKILDVKVKDFVNEYERVFMLVANEDEEVYLELFNNNDYLIEKDDWGEASEIEVHIIKYHSIKEGFNVKSYYNYSKGRTINLNGAADEVNNTIKSDDTLSLVSENSKSVNIKFEDIPPIDIVARSSRHSGHCHVTNNLSPTSCNPNELFIDNNGFKKFYTCILNNDEAKYHIENIDINAEGEYVISLASMNKEMQSFSYPKNLHKMNLSNLSVNLYNPLGRLSLFNYTDPHLFTGEEVKFYVPKNINRDESYGINITYKDELSYSYSLIHDKKLPDYIEFINAELQVLSNKHEIHLNVTGDYDFVRGHLFSDNSTWSYYNDRSAKIELFQIPSYICDEIGCEEVISDYYFHYASLVKYPDFEFDYFKMLDDLFRGDFNSPSFQLECSYGAHF